MSTSVENLYGVYAPARPDYIDQYGVTDNKYGAILEPEIYSFLLSEDSSFILQEDNTKIALG
jgi:hypothetical protein